MTDVVIVYNVSDIQVEVHGKWKISELLGFGFLHWNSIAESTNCCSYFNLKWSREATLDACVASLLSLITPKDKYLEEV